MPSELPSELDDLRQQLLGIKQQADGLLSGKTAGQLAWRPEPGRWSMAECLDHLNITAEAILPRFDGSIAAGKPASAPSDGQPRRSLLGGWMIRTVEPPPRKRFKAAKSAQPRPNLQADSVVPRFLAFQDQFMERLDRSAALDLWKTKVRHFAIPLWPFGLGELYTIILAHERRHLWQAEQVTKAPGFPAA